MDLPLQRFMIVTVTPDGRLNVLARDYGATVQVAIRAYRRTDVLACLVAKRDAADSYTVEAFDNYGRSALTADDLAKRACLHINTPRTPEDNYV